MKMNNFIAYDYKELNSKDTYCSMMIDSYENFGWHVDENVKDSKKVILKRNQKIMNKAELTRLQRNFESCLHEIEALNKSKQSTAIIYSLSIGIIGTVFLALSVFAVTATPMNVILCLVFGIPGMIGWILPVFVYKYMYKKREKEITPLIEHKYDEIYEVCEKGHKVVDD